MAIGTRMGTSGRRRRYRLGAGEFVAAGAPLPRAQRLYLFAISRWVPDALRELLEIVGDDDAGLAAWAARRRVTDDWVLRNIRSNWEFWREEPDTVGRWRVHVPQAFWVPMFTWEPDRETFDQYSARVKNSPGLMRTPEKAENHFEWLAKYQVGGVSVSELAAHAEVNLETVSEALGSTARLVGVTLRPARRGPRRTKT